MTCEHKSVHATESGARHYCLDCGQFMLPPYDYRRALEDSRRLQWRPAKDFKPKLGKVYIGALFMAHSKIWNLMRVRWSEDLEDYVLAQENAEVEAHRCFVDFIAEDTMGTPYVSERLPSVAA